MDMVAPTVVLAEDDRATRYAMTTLLRRHGFDVVACEDGQVAHDRIKDLNGKHTPPAALVTDIDMPNMTGDALADSVRHEADMPHALPILVTSGNPDVIDRMRRDHLADEFLSKPVDTGEMFTILDRLVGGPPNPPERERAKPNDPDRRSNGGGASRWD